MVVPFTLAAQLTSSCCWRPPDAPPLHAAKAHQTNITTITSRIHLRYRNQSRICCNMPHAALGGAFFYLRATLRGTPEEMALLDIGRAERLHREATTAAGTDPDRSATVGRAGHLLAEARLAFDRHAFPEARAAAQQSQAFA